MKEDKLIKLMKFNMNKNHVVCSIGLNKEYLLSVKQYASTTLEDEMVSVIISDTDYQQYYQNFKMIMSEIPEQYSCPSFLDRLEELLIANKMFEQLQKYVLPIPLDSLFAKNDILNNKSIIESTNFEQAYMNMQMTERFIDFDAINYIAQQCQSNLPIVFYFFMTKECETDRSLKTLKNLVSQYPSLFVLVFSEKGIKGIPFISYTDTLSEASTSFVKTLK